MPGTSVSVACQNCATPPICAGSPLNFSLAVNNSFDSQASYFYKNYKNYSEIPGPGFYKAGPMQAFTTIYPHHSLFGVVKVDWNPRYHIYVNNAYFTTTSSNTFSYIPQDNFTIRAELDMGYNWTFWDGANFCNITENSPSAGSARAACNSNSYLHSSYFNTAIVSSTVAISGIVQGPVIDNIAGPLVVNAGSINDYQLNTQGQTVNWTVNPLTLIQNNTQNSKILKLKAPNTSGTLTLNAETYNLQTCPTAKSTATTSITVTNVLPSTPVLDGYRNSNYAMTIKWTPATDENGTIANYKVYKATDINIVNNYPESATFGGAMETLASGVLMLNYSIPGESWNAFRVTAVDNEGLESKPSNIIYYQADNIAPPSPTNFTYSPASNGLRKLAWNATADFSGIKRYDIYYNGQKWRATESNSYLFGIGELGSLFTHKFKVTAIDNLANESIATAEVQFDLDAKAPDIPANLKYSDMTLNSANIFWDKSIDNSGIAPYYIIRKYSMANVLLETLTSTGVNKMLTGLLDEEAFILKVSAMDGSGNESAASAPLNLVIDLTAPTQPLGLTTIAGQNTIRRLGLTWQPSTDLNLKGYYIYKDGVQLNTIAVTSNTFTVTGVSDVYKSEYTVKAVDVNENLSVESNKLIVTPPVLVIDPVNIRVGIGVFNPEERLDVDENIQINDGNLIFSGTDNNSRKIYPKQGGNIQIHTITTIAGHTILNTNSGNVGIGTINPSTEKLEVAGNIKSTGTLIGVALNVANVTVNDKISTNKLLAATLTVTGTLRSQNIYNESSIFTDGLQTQNLKSGLIEANNITGTVVSAVNLSTTNLAADYSYTKNTFTESLTVLSGFTLLEPSSFPAALWKLEGTTLSYANQVHSKGDLRVGNAMVFTSNTMLGIHAINSGGNLRLQNQATTDRVTIGTLTNPQNYKLEVGGGINAEGLIKATQITAGFVTATNSLYLGYASFVYNLANTQIDLSNATLNINGLLKTQTLGISGDITAATLAGIGTRMVVADANGKLMTLAIPSQTSIGALAGTGTRLVVADARGNLNTQNFPEPISAGDVANLEMTKIKFGAEYQNNDPVYFQRVDNDTEKTTLKLNIGDASDASDKLEIGYTQWDTQVWTPKMSFASDGNARFFGKVAIGEKVSKASDYTLSVDGRLYAKRLTTMPDKDWADYVFEEEYELMSLENLDKYIMTYKRLPKMPKGTYINNNGYDVGEMNRLQMEKIEELTRYVIELKKEINELKLQK